ncbi:MAG: PAS domain S-box protein [candidate division Zixibacteria bacterium]|nr:PAS domain S-box protein [candidate division Zixibacteria bacterium]
MKIRTKIYFISLSLILIVGLSTLLIVRDLSTKAIKREISTRLTANAQSRAHHIETVLGEYKNITLTLAAGNPFRDAVNTKINSYQRVKQVNRRIKSIIQSYDDISRIRVLNKNGIIIASSNTDVGLDKSAQDIFLKGKESAYLGDLHISKFTNDIVISASAPIFLNGLFSGVVVINFNTDKLFSITEDKTGLGKTGEIYLVNKDDYIITPSRFLDDAVLKKKIDIGKLKHDFINAEQTSSQEHENIALSFKNYRGIDILAVHSYIHEMDWILLAEISEDEAFAPVDDLTNKILLIIAVLLVFGVLLSFFVSNNITKPILKLYQGAEEISKGNLNHTIGIKAKDEIGQLANMFDDMTLSLRKSQEKTEKHSRVLEKTVKARTKELREKIEEIEQQNAVMANIASDLGDANENLEKEAEERKQTVKALQESEEKFYSLSSNALDAIIMMGPQGEITFWNKASENMFGYSSDEVIGKGLHAIIVPEKYREKYVKAFPLFEKTGQGAAIGKTLELTALRKDESEFPVELSVWAIRLQEHWNAVGIIRDITERKQAEEKIKQTMSELERFNKIAVGRELRMIELKKNINELYQEKGEPPIYKTDFNNSESKNDLLKANK